MNTSNTGSAAAYAHMSDKVLRSGIFFFSLLSSPFVRILLPYIPQSTGYLPVLSSYLRRSAFPYFCGGESKEACLPTIEALCAQNIGTALDYAAEGGTRAEHFHKNTEEIMQCLVWIQTKETVRFLAIKPSALGDTRLMRKKQENLSLSTAETHALESFEERMHILCQQAQHIQKSLLIDAEESDFQNYVDAISLQLMRKYNTTYPCVYHTFQLYRKDTYKKLTDMHQIAKKEGFLLGAKLVRGAYMEKERQMARKLRIASPIHKDKAACDHAYDKALQYAVTNYKDIALFAGTHNVQSCQYLEHLLDKENLPDMHPHIVCSQLYGMRQVLSYHLAQRGVYVAKYLPYGPYQKLLPYLYRRALENSSLKSQSREEYTILRQELKRRRNK